MPCSSVSKWWGCIKSHLTPETAWKNQKLIKISQPTKTIITKKNKRHVAKLFCTKMTYFDSMNVILDNKCNKFHYTQLRRFSTQSTRKNYLTRSPTEIETDFASAKVTLARVCISVEPCSKKISKAIYIKNWGRFRYRTLRSKDQNNGQILYSATFSLATTEILVKILHQTSHST